MSFGTTRGMLNSELGLRRWKLVRKPNFWLKMFEMILPVVICPLFVLFNQTATVHVKGTTLYYNITLMFPYTFKENTTVVIPPTFGLPKFNFEPTLLPSAILFVAAVGMALVVAIGIFSCYVAFHGTPRGQAFMIRYYFAALVVVFVLLVSNCFWMVSLVRLKNHVNEKIEEVFEICEKDKAHCEEFFPNYITLYISTAFAILLTIVWLADAITTYFIVVHTIPEEISQTTLVRNIELSPSSTHKILPS